MDNQESASPALLAPIDAQRANNFDFLRFTLATLVVVSHCYLLTSLRHVDFLRTEPVLRVTRGQIDGGALAVDGFFLISGFLITHSWQHSRRPTDYLRKRVLRIYPGFLAAVLFGICVVGPLGTTDLRAYGSSLHPLRTLYYMAQLVGPNLTPVFTNLPAPNQINGSLWTIRYEFWCYLLVVALGLLRLLPRRGLVLAFCLPVYAAYGVQAALHLVLMQGREIRLLGAPDNYPRFLTYFLVGMVFYLYRDRVLRSRGLLLLSVGLLLAAAWAGRGLEAILPWCGGYALFYTAFSPALRLHDFARYGDLSYGIYLYAFPIQQLVLYALHGNLSPPMLFALAFPVTVLFALLSWHLVEKPFLKKKPASTIEPVATAG
jgi:peptidoglycan/LPS O-acetylase OafA/YrhL